MTYRGPTREQQQKAKKPGHHQQRYLHRGHFAFMRGLVEGLPHDEVWDRYLSVEGRRSDERVVQSTLRWIRAEFVAAAKRHARPGTARLLGLDLPPPAPKDQAAELEVLGIPSLADFALDEGLDDERESEQIAAYEARYGALVPRNSGKDRLRRRQLDALRWLEELVSRRPAAADEIAAWLRPELARALNVGGLFTVAQLAERIQGMGRGWASGVRGIGALKAARIADWVREHGSSIGVELGAHVQRPRGMVRASELATVLAPATAVRPLEKFVVPSQLDGSRGAYRQPQAHCMLQASNDLEAILAWLGAKRGPSELQEAAAVKRPLDTQGAGEPPAGHAAGPQRPSRRPVEALSHTQRSYRKEAERLLLWAVLERRKPLSSLTAEDCTAYRDFLADPQPRSRWCGPRARQRWSPLWRPFEGPLSPAAQRQALSILKSLWAFMVEQNYIMGNPWSAVVVPRAPQRGLGQGRSLTHDQWAFVQSQAAAAGTGHMAARLRLALGLLYATGLRASEVVALQCRDIEAVEYLGTDGDEPTRGWMLSVLGKGSKLREVPVPQAWVNELAAYLQMRGLNPNVSSEANTMTHLLGIALDDVRSSRIREPAAIDPKAGISVATLYRQLRGFFQACSRIMRAAGDDRGASRLALASTHWMRHTHATHALASGVKIEVAQQNLGHVSLGTTTAYVTTEKAGRMRAMEEFWAAGSNIAQ